MSASAWRSAASRARIVRADSGRAAAAPSPAEHAAAVESPATPFHWHGVIPRIPGIERPEWSIAFIGLLLYVFTITSFRYPIGEVSVAIALVGVAVGGRRLRVLPLPLLLYTAFLVWAFIGYAHTAYPETVGERIVDSIKVWLIIVAALNAIATRGQLHFFMLFYVATFVLFPTRGAMANYFVYSHALSGRAVWRGFFENPNDLASIALLLLSTVIATLVVERRAWARLSLYVSLVALPVLILMTQSRAVFIGLVAAVAMMVAGHRRRLRAMAAVVVVGLVAVAVAPRGVWERLEGLQNATSTSNLRAVDREGSAAERFAIWQTAARIIRDYPVAGVGIGAYKQAHEEYAPEQGGRDTHSTYLNVLAETGLVGLSLFVLTVVGTLAGARRARRKWGALAPDLAAQLRFLEIGLAALMIAALWGSYSKLTYFYLHFVLLWLLTDLLQRSAAEKVLPAGTTFPDAGGRSFAPAAMRRHR